jgi:uncharacterized membrane protein
MAPDEADDLPRRVEELERTVDEQRRTLEQLRAELRALRSALADRAEAPAPPSPPAPSDTAPAEGSRSSGAPSAGGGESRGDSPDGFSPSWLRRFASWSDLRSEDWLNYVGIALFLFGVAFLFRYSVEQGWLVPGVRVGLGAALGSALLATGLRLRATRRPLRPVLLGGSGATFYATLFAAHQLYGLVAYAPAFGGMGIVTVALVGLAVRQAEPTLALVGVLGGLGTPFLLYNEAGGLAGLSLYLCAVVGGACAVFWRRGWQSLLYVTVAGGWTAFFVTVVRATAAASPPPGRWALQGGIGVAWLLLAGTPVLRALRRRRAPAQWPLVPPPRWLRPVLGGDRPAYGLVTASPFLAVACTRLLWDAPDGTWPVVAGLGAAVYAGVTLGLRRASLPDYAPPHGLVAAVLAAYGLTEALGGAALLVGWSVEGVLLLVLARRVGGATLRRTGHALFAVVGAGLAFRLSAEAGRGPPIVTAPALSELVVLGLAAAAAAVTTPRALRWAYRGGVLVGWLGWTAHELAPLPDGPAYVSLLWGLTAAGLLVVGARAGRRPLQLAGLAVLVAFVGKLFLVDLASLPPLWRIALFLGFGAAFLGISYLLPGLLPAPTGAAAPSED